LGSTSKAGREQDAETPPIPFSQEPRMAIHKVIEVISQSDKSWEDAAQAAITDAGKTVKNIKSIYVEHLEGVVQKNKIVQYRLNGKITFEVV
jgi:flavin-binding protein dodecin